MELALTGRLVSADEAKDIGLLLDLVEPEDLLSTAIGLLGQIASNPHKPRATLSASTNPRSAWNWQISSISVLWFKGFATTQMTTFRP